MVIEKPLLDNREYRSLTLKSNSLDVLLVSDPKCDKAAAALDVNVGHFADQDIAGLAHYLEHMLFMGTKVENEYSTYLSENGGYSNAFTGSEHTNYFFQKSALYGALDRFSKFFISPLFSPDSLDREVLAVDSEHKKNLQSDQWRLYQLFKDLSDPAHPMCSFGTGDVSTLKRDGIRDALLEFHSKYYSTSIMALVVYGAENLDTLQTWVEELFSEAKDLGIKPPRFEGDVHPTGPEQVGKIVRVKPVKDLRYLEIVFPLPSTMAHYKTKPVQYFSHLAGHEGAGSILSALKKHGWALGLSSYSSYDGSGFDHFCVQEYENVIHVVFDYIRLMQNPEEWIWREMQTLAAIDFKFKEASSNPAGYVSRLAGDMHKFSPEQYISGNYTYTHYDEALIREFLSYLKPSSFRLIVVASTFHPDESEGWSKGAHNYGTPYHLDHIPAAMLSRLEQRREGWEADGLALPRRNEFVPDSYDLVDTGGQASAFPEMIMDEDTIRVWHCLGQNFKVPKAILRIDIKSPMSYLDPVSAVKSDLFCMLLQDQLTETTYYAELAGLKYHANNTGECISIKVQGYDNKMHVLLECVVSAIRNLDMGRLEILKEQLMRGYKSWSLNSPYEHAMYYANYWLQDTLWHADEKVKAMEEITTDSMHSFISALFERTHTELFAHGNILPDRAKQFAEIIKTGLNSRPLAKALRFRKSRMGIIEPGNNIIVRETVRNPGNVNSAIEYSIQCGDLKDIRVRALTGLFCEVIKEPCFDTLRTNEQLGYLVWSMARYRVGITGIRFVIQSEYSPWYLHERINAFLYESFDKTAKSMEEATFQNFKKSRLRALQEPDKNLSQENSRYYGNVSSHYYDFDKQEKEAECVESLTLSDLLEFYENTVKTGGKLIVWVKSEKKFGQEWQEVADTTVAENVTEFKNGLRFAAGASAH